MNEFFEKVMTFINENTYLLIGICIFLILVLVGYLIDNSVKSKRVRKDIKNKDQVPENIKNEIIKEAINENKEKIMENSFHNAVREESEIVNVEDSKLNNKEASLEDAQKKELDLNEVLSKENLNTSLNLDNNDISVPFSLDAGESSTEESDNSIFNEPLILSSPDENIEENNNQNITVESLISENDNNLFNLDKNNIEENDNLIIDTPINIDLNPMDPDAEVIAKNKEQSIYKNDKKLSEILLNVDKVRVNNNKENSEIFEDPTLNIKVDSDIKKSKIEIDEGNSFDELDKIMKKLSTISNDEDNYTNIF